VVAELNVSYVHVIPSNNADLILGCEFLSPTHAILNCVWSIMYLKTIASRDQDLNTARVTTLPSRDYFPPYDCNDSDEPGVTLKLREHSKANRSKFNRLVSANNMNSRPINDNYGLKRVPIPCYDRDTTHVNSIQVKSISDTEADRPNNNLPWSLTYYSRNASHTKLPCTYVRKSSIN